MAPADITRESFDIFPSWPCSPANPLGRCEGLHAIANRLAAIEQAVRDSSSRRAT